MGEARWVGGLRKMALSRAPWSFPSCFSLLRQTYDWKEVGETSSRSTNTSGSEKHDRGRCKVRMFYFDRSSSPRCADSKSMCENRGSGLSLLQNTLLLARALLPHACSMNLSCKYMCMLRILRVNHSQQVWSITVRQFRSAP